MGCSGCQPPVFKRRTLEKLPENKPTDPVERPDGSLLFSGIAETRDGYIIDPKNAKRLIPDTAPCLYRINSPLLDAFGKTSVMNQCNHPEHEKRGMSVTPADCESCPLRNLS